MTYKGDNIIGKPSLGLIQVYIEEKSLGLITPQEVFDYWDKKDWLTKKGSEVKTLEAAINVYNSIVVQKTLKGNKKTRKEIKSAFTAIKKKNKQPKKHSEYSEQLKDERWKAFRWFVMKVRGNECEICKSTNNLQVHHIEYIKNAKAWEYNVNQVMVVCRDCHKQIHNIK